MSESYIIQRIVNTTRKRIEPVAGYTTYDVCKALNDGYAEFMKLCPPGCDILHGCQHEKVIVLKDDRGYPDPARVIARVTGSEGSVTDCVWKVGTEGESPFREGLAEILRRGRDDV